MVSTFFCIYFSCIKIQNIIEGVLDDSLIACWTLVVAQYLAFIEWLNCVHVNCTCQITLETFPDYVREFAHNLRTILQKDNVVTPYLHALIYHVPAMIAEHGSLRPFSTSAQELKNSVQTLIQFRASNQHDVPLDLEVFHVLQYGTLSAMVKTRRIVRASFQSIATSK